jgi:hypothetical protein
MADNNGGSATTVLIAVIIVVIIGAAFYFGFARGHWGNGADNGINVDVTLPTGSGEGGGAAQ